MKMILIRVAASCSLAFCAAAGAQTATNLVCTSCVGETDIANQAVTSAKIANGTVAGADIKANAITSDKILNGSVSKNDLAPQVRDLLDGAIVDMTIQRVVVSAAGAAGAECPSGRIPVSASCECDDVNGSRNYGVLFSCTIAGMGAISGCFDEASSFNPTLPAPLAIARAVCLGAKTADGTPWVPSAVAAADAVSPEAESSRAAYQAQWMKEQHATFEAALAKLKSRRASYEQRAAK